MNDKTVALIARIRRLHEQAQVLLTDVAPATSSTRLLQRLTRATTAVDSAYAAACVAGGADRFIVHVAAAAREARRAHRILQDLTHLGHVNIDSTRELILEARGIANILAASRATARRRRGERRAAAGAV